MAPSRVPQWNINSESDSEYQPGLSQSESESEAEAEAEPEHAMPAPNNPPKKRRGPSRGLALLKAIDGGMRLELIWNDGELTPVGAGSQYWSPEVSRIVRTHGPVLAATWKEVTEEHKMLFRDKLLESFVIHFGNPNVDQGVENQFKTAHRNWRNRMLKHYNKLENEGKNPLDHPYQFVSQDDWERLCERYATPECKKRSQINSNNKKKSKVNHSSGPKNFMRRRYELRNPETGEIPGRVDLYKDTHFRKKAKVWVTSEAENNYKSMEDLRNGPEGQSMSQDEVAERVLGHKSGYIRGLGNHIRSPHTFSSSSSTSRVAETEARLATTTKELAQTRAQLETTQAQLEEYKASQADTQRQLDEFRETQATTQKHLDEMFALMSQGKQN